jgi:hypothetical protein
MNSALDCFQWTERESAGGDTDAGDPRLVQTRRLAARLVKMVASEGASDQGKRFRRKSRGLAYLGSSESSGLGRRHLRSPVRNFCVARRRFREEAKGDGGGRRGGSL